MYSSYKRLSKNGSYFTHVPNWHRFAVLCKVLIKNEIAEKIRINKLYSKSESVDFHVLIPMHMLWMDHGIASYTFNDRDRIDWLQTQEKIKNVFPEYTFTFSDTPSRRIEIPGREPMVRLSEFLWCTIKRV